MFASVHIPEPSGPRCARDSIMAVSPAGLTGAPSNSTTPARALMSSHSSKGKREDSPQRQDQPRRGEGRKSLTRQRLPCCLSTARLSRDVWSTSTGSPVCTLGLQTHLPLILAAADQTLRVRLRPTCDEIPRFFAASRSKTDSRIQQFPAPGFRLTSFRSAAVRAFERTRPNPTCGAPLYPMCT